MGSAWVYGDQFGRVCRAVIPPALLATIWLSLADHVAISQGVWSFGEGKNLGLRIGAVPVEEVLFFLITNLLVGFGLALLSARRRTGVGAPLIPAQKEGPLSWAVARYVDAKVRKSFRGVWLRGELPSGDEGLLIYANHSSFWDGFTAHALCGAAGWDGHCLMEEQNLARYPFLARIGAFSIRRHEAASSLESLRYAQRLLKRGAAVFVFPEGEMHARATLRPLERGIEVLARAAQARCLPVAFRYVFLEHELPDILVQVGEAHAPTPLSGFAERLGELTGGARPGPLDRGVSTYRPRSARDRGVVGQPTAICSSRGGVGVRRIRPGVDSRRSVLRTEGSPAGCGARRSAPGPLPDTPRRGGAHGRSAHRSLSAPR